MQETSKCRALRLTRGDFKTYLKGSGIDIGAGNDALIVEEGSVRSWDTNDGDAQLMQGVLDNTYDFAYSSHCLEHVRDVKESLTNWARIVKSGGFVYIVVPEYVLYEQLSWPSRFNGDHKQSFSFLVHRTMVNRDNHYHMDDDLVPLAKTLGLELVRGSVEDTGYDYNKGGTDQTMGPALAQLCLVFKKNS